MEQCPLCVLKIRDNTYYEDELIIILNCKDCLIPMIVFKEHSMDIPKNIQSWARLISKQIFGSGITFRTKQGKILDHMHFHIIK